MKNYSVQLLLVNPGTGVVTESNFEAVDIKIGERFVSFEMAETKIEEGGMNVESLHTANFPYENIMQFNVKKG